MKKILILGGYGFLGRNLNEVLIGDYIIVNESRRTGCDILVLDNLIKKIKKVSPDIIIYAAANVGSVHHVYKYKADIISENSKMCINLYEAINSVDKNIQVINPIGNCSYPDKFGIQSESQWWDGELNNTVESYGFARKLSYVVSRCYKNQYGINTVNIIIPNAYGEYDSVDPEKSHALNGIIMRMIKAQANKEKKFVIWGTGSPVREWIYMKDVARVIKYIIDNEFFDLPNPLNIGQRFGFSILESAKLIKKYLNYDVEFVFDHSRQDGAIMKILENDIFKKYCSDFIFTDYKIGIENTINYYKLILQ
jgi:GDP-L-fucose synthase